MFFVKILSCFSKLPWKTDDRVELSLSNFFSLLKVMFSLESSWIRSSKDASLGLSSHFVDETFSVIFYFSFFDWDLFFLGAKKSYSLLQWMGQLSSSITVKCALTFSASLLLFICIYNGPVPLQTNTVFLHNILQVFVWLFVTHSIASSKVHE